MESFPQQLIEARKRKGITQEQLADLLNISRPTVSRWENGHALPDFQSLKQLTMLLQYDFMTGRPLNPPADAPTAEIPSAAPAPAVQPRGKKKILFLCLAAAATVICLAIGFLFFGKESLPAKTSAEPYSYDWYLAGNTAEPGKAHLHISIESPSKLQRNDLFPEGLGWFYIFTVEEMHGIDVRITSVTETHFRYNGTEGQIAYTADMISRCFPDGTATQGNRYAVSGGMPQQPIRAVAVLVQGVDQNGREVSGWALCELSEEIAE